jgi:hypothetical protein
MILLLPSTRDGTRSEIDWILGRADLLRKTVFFVPPTDALLGAGVGPHLEIGATKGPIAGVNLRDDAIKALAQLLQQAPIARIEKDDWGALVRLAPDGHVAFYCPLRMARSASLNPFTVGSNLRLDQRHLQRAIERVLSEVSENA